MMLAKYISMSVAPMLALLCLLLSAGEVCAAEGDVYRLLEASSLRQGPDSSSAATASAAKGARMIELKRTGKWKKVRVSASGNVGWLPVHVLAVNSGVQLTEGVFTWPLESSLLPVTKPTAAKPTVAKPTVAKPTVAKSTVAKSTVAKSTVAKEQELVMAPNQKSVDRDAVSPIFEDGAIVHKVQHQPLNAAVIGGGGSENAVSKTAKVQQRAKAPLSVMDIALTKTDHVFYRFTNKANLRAGPNVKYDAVAWALAGEKAIALDQKGSWFRVQMNVSKRIGWAYKDSLLSVAGEMKKTPKLALGQASPKRSAKVAKKIQKKPVIAAAVPHKLKAEAGQAPARSNVDAFFTFPNTTAVRTDPNVASHIVAWASAGSKAVRRGKKGHWVQVQMQMSQQKGWVDQNALQMPSSKKGSSPVLHGGIKPLKIASAQMKKNKPVTPKAMSAQKAISAQKVTPVQKIKANHSDKKSAASVPSKPMLSKPISIKLLSSKPVPSAVHKPLPAQALSTVGGVKTPYAHVLMQTTMIRKTPSALSEVLGWAGRGAPVERIGQQGKWVQVRMQESGRMGWVEAASFHAAGVASMPAVKPDHQMIQQQNTVLAKAEATPRVAQSDKQPVVTSTKTASVSKKTPVIAKAATVKGTAKSTMPAVQKPIKNLYTFNKKSNMRAGPNVKFDTVSWAGVGAKAIELDRVGDWLRIQMLVSKRIGWVFQQSLDLVALGAGVAKASVGLGSAAPGVLSLASSAVATAERGATTKPSAVSTSAALKLQSFDHALQQKPTAVNHVLEKPAAGNVADKKVTEGKGLARKTQPLNISKQTKLAKKEAANQVYFFKQTSNLRAGPGKQFERIGWGGRNESANVIAHQGDWKRVRMTISGKIGWVFQDYVIRAVGTDYHVIAPKRKALAGVVQAGKPAGQGLGQEPGQKSGRMYQVIRTEPLRADAGDFSELIGSVQKGDTVAWLEERNGWARVNPQLDGSKVGWIEARLLKPSVTPKFKHTQAINKGNVATYSQRVSKGEVFNFSYAALEEALYKVPVEDIHIRISKADLKAIFLKRQYDQSPFEIRLKTGRHNLRGTVKVLGSSTRIFKKKSLLIKLDKESGRWYGHRRIALRSMASDKALMREWMAWKMMAALGMKVPEVHFTRVSFNHGEKTGFYLSIEWMGPEFLAANNLDAHGEFYQPNDATHCGDLYSPKQVSLCFDQITPRTGDYSNLETMAVAVNAATADNIDQVLEKYFDVESVINWIAVNALTTNGDTYNKNYWLYYHPTQHKWTIVPWDYNLTFGRVYDQYGVKAFRIFNDNFQYYYPPDVGAGNPIKDKLLRNPKLRARLEAKIRHLTGLEADGSEHTFGWFSPTVMHARIANLAAVVGKEVYKDTFLSYDENDFTKTYESLMHYVTAHDYFLKTKLFGDFPWYPEPPNQPFIPMRLPDQLLGSGQIHAGGESLMMVDRGWGYFVARIALDKPLKSTAKFDVHVEGGITPKYLPTGQTPRRCIERSWLLSSKTKDVSVTANVMFEYMQENSRRSEVSPVIHEEMLELWMLDGKRWKPIQTELNEYSNTLIAKGVHVKSGHEYRFVACSPF